MGVISYLSDRLSNVMSGMGTGVDRAIHNHYHLVPVTPQQVEAAYRSSWLMRKIVDIPPLDMTRAWRQWQADSTDIEAIEREERRLQVKAKVKRALRLARLMGGGALILGVKGETDPTQPLLPDRIAKQGLAYIRVRSRWQMTIGQQITDPASPWCDEPEYYELGDNSRLKLHPSRVIPFVGQPLPEGSVYAGANWFWGDPLYQSIEQAIENSDLSQDGFAALISEAKLDILKIPGLMQNVGTQEYQDRLMKRLQAAQMGKSTWRALMIDGEEEWEQRQVNWAGMPDIITSYLQIVAGAADIPVTRLLGQSPKGLQSNGDGEYRDYHDMIAARQDEIMTPAFDRLDELLIRSALGSRPDDIWYSFNSLDKLSPKDAAEIEDKRAKTVKTYADTGLFPDQALAALAKNAVNESGQWPGSEKAFEEAEKAGTEPDGGDDDDADLQTEEERAAAVADVLGLTDAKPVPLYVQRKLLNAAEVIAWAKEAGFTSTLDPDDMHVTVLYSRTAVDPMKMGNDWIGDGKGELAVKPGGPRAVERLGENAVVLLFASWELVSRHNDMVSLGASHDWDEYQPHITLTYEAPADLDLDTIKPYPGALRFGPELFQPLDLDWKSKIVEDGGGPHTNRPFDDAKRRNKGQRLSRRSRANGFDPSQPRDRFGRWIPTARRNYVNDAAKGATNTGQLEIGRIGERARRLLDRRGVQVKGDAIALDASMVRHIAVRHSGERGGQRDVTGTDVASAGGVLNAARTVRLATPARNGSQRFAVRANAGAEQIYAVFEVRKKAVALVTMWKRGG